MRIRKVLRVSLIFGAGLFALAIGIAQAQTGAGDDPVARLGRDIEAGKVHLSYDDDRGLLPWLLDALRIPPESQMLVFSKTGVQAIRTGPLTPRHIYFNDSAIVATVNGGPIEIAAQDPVRGIVFYLLDQTPFRFREFLARPRPISPFVRRTDCLTCHASGDSSPARLLIRSVVTDPQGTPLERFGARDTDDRTPFDKLWGGWFVTGKSTGRHMGNTVLEADGALHTLKPVESSDVAALMVFEHQTRVMNLIARVARASDANAPAANAIDELSTALLFTDEPPLPSPVEGSSGFAAKFATLGPRDQQGRSLRDLDLQTRLMRFPASYMIYSDAFQALPRTVRSAVYSRMAALPGTRKSEDRQAVLEILLATLKDFPDPR